MAIEPDFDPEKLEPLLGGPVRIAPVSGGGQSNPTWFVRCGGRDLVLRKKPSGATADSAHAIDREYRIMSALQDTGVPVPRMVWMEADPGIIGTPFYLMERLEGEVSADTALPALAPQSRTQVHLHAAQILAALHRLDWRALGLADYGRHDGYYRRQVRRWRTQWHAAGAKDARIDEMTDWFSENIPVENPAAIVHGDFRIGNMLHATNPGRITGVLDWELSTLGDPMADLAHWAMFYDMAPDQMGGLAGLDLTALGLPDRSAFLNAYRNAGGCPAPLTAFHRAFALYRLSVILYGITARARAGQSTSDDARAVGALAPDLARLAEKVLATDTPGFT